MSRQLKFRIWDNHTNRYATSVYETNKDCYLFIGRSGYVTAFNCYGEEIDFKDGRLIIQQFTGLQDKNGKDIYEGDIILNNIDHDEIRPVLCVVGWSVYEEIGFATFYPQKEVMEPLKKNFNGVDLYEEYPMCYGRGHGYEVIGNIFENPELLQKLA